MILSTYLQKRGCNSKGIQKSINSALQNNRNTLRNKKKREKTGIPLVFITKYHHCLRKISVYLRKNWHKLERDQDCKKIFKEKPIVAYARHRNLADFIINSKI